MKMTLRQFIDEGGISAAETYRFPTGRELSSKLFNCLKDETIVNRDTRVGVLKRFRRKLFFDYGIGDIPLRSEVLEYQKLYWGRVGNDIALETVRSLLKRLSTVKTRRDYQVFIGFSDDAFTAELAAMIPESVERIYAVNCDVEHPKLQWYPLGRDAANIASYDVPPRQDKELLVYSNFSVGTHPSRETVRVALEGKEFITSVSIEGYGQNEGYPMTNKRFIEELNNHAFAICPRGRGVDTYRMWDCIYLGVVPIVVREAAFQKQTTQLPILFLDDVTDFGMLTREFLEDKHAEMLDTEYDYEILLDSYWKKRFPLD